MMVRVKMFHTRGLLCPIIFALSIIVSPMIVLQNEAYYHHPYEPQSLDDQQQQRALNDYYLQSLGPLPKIINTPVDGMRRQPLGQSPRYQLEPEPELLNYLSLPGGVGPEPRLDQLDTQKLIAYLATQLQQDYNKDDREVNENTIVGDLNSHLSPTDPLSNTISGPVNDPADFEAVLSQLTNSINHELPNSSNRSAILDNLLSVYLGTIMQQLKQQQQQLQRLEDNSSDDSNNQIIIVDSDNENSMAATTEAEIGLRSASSTPSASRYGSGEYIDHPLALIGHQYVQGGAGEGRQLLGPEGAFENVQVVKSDHAVPSYCDPPNPCPIGFTAEDGCLEKFVNSASFSREYQVKQQCSCDNEHSLFNCASPVSTIKSQVYSVSPSQVGGSGDTHSQPTSTGDAQDDDTTKPHTTDNWLETLARTIQNRFGGLASVRNLVGNNEKTMTNGHANDDEQYSNIVKKGFQIGSDFKY